MRILYVLKHDPWGIGGGCYASKRYLELFTSVFEDSEFDVCICEEYLKHGKVSEFENANFIPVPPRSITSKALTPLTGILHRHQKKTIELLSRNKYDYCIFDHNSIAGTLAKKCKKRNIKSIVLNHNCEYEYFRDNNKGLKRFFILHWVEKCEKRAYRICDFNIFLTEEDELLFKERYGRSNTMSIVGGMFNSRDGLYRIIDDGSKKPYNINNPRIIISGTMGNIQNMDGINYFLDSLYPALPKNVTVILAGKNPPKELVNRLDNYDNIELVANPQDMDAVVRGCDIYVCPARLGGGIKMRVLDGFKNGLPAIVHKVSFRGYSTFANIGICKEFDTPESFRYCFDAIIANMAEKKFTKYNIIEQYNRLMSFDDKVAAFKKVF